MWPPVTLNAVPTTPGWVMVPIEFGEPSPQSIVAVKSPIGAVRLASVKVPTTVAAGSATPVFGAGAKATGAPAASAASAMTAVEAPEAVIGVGGKLSLSVTETNTWYVPSSGSV